MTKSNFSKIPKLLKRVAFRLTKKNTLVEIISSLLIILFIYTGLSKMIDHNTFKFQLGRSPYVQDISSFIAATLPILELIVAFGLILPKTRLLSLYASFFLMFLFTGYIAIMLSLSYYLPCSCGGILAAMSWKQHLIFNSIFTLLTIIAILLHTASLSGYKHSQNNYNINKSQMI